MTYPDNREYVGEWKDGKYSGQGTLTFPSGWKYVGEFRDDKFNGQGTMTNPDGEKYVGVFRNGVRNGLGIEYRADGSILQSGIWENNVFVSGQQFKASPDPGQGRRK